jgi:TPR repeat protein
MFTGRRGKIEIPIAAMINLGVCDEDGTGVVQNCAVAAQCYKTCAESGGSDMAWQRYGRLLRKGLGVAKDPVTALRCFEKAAEGGNALAMRYIGEMYQNGEGVAQNDAMAVRRYEQAMQHRDGASALALALMIKNGRGVPRDLRKAEELLRWAIQQGCESARYELANLPRV